MVQSFKKSRIDDDKFLITGADYEVRCVKWPAPDEVVPTIPASDPVPVLKSIIISWTAPTARENGALFTMAELREFWLFITIDEVEQKIVVSPDKVAWRVDNLEAGTIYTQVLAVDTDGLTSERTDVVMTTIN